MINKPWSFDDPQTITIRDRKYEVHEALRCAKDLPVKELRLDELYISYCNPAHDTLRDFVAHIKSVMEADLDHPILLNEDGACIDGKHRICKALLEGKETIKAKRFETDPGSCYTTTP
jgi:hypothetical protein